MRPTEKAIFSYRTVDGTHEVEGFFVPNTNRIFAVDEREEDTWVATHVPTGHAIRSGFGLIRFGCAAQACALAQRFHREVIAAGGKVESPNILEVVGCIRDLSEADQRAFWERIL